MSIITKVNCHIDLNMSLLREAGDGYQFVIPTENQGNTTGIGGKWLIGVQNDSSVINERAVN